MTDVLMEENRWWNSPNIEPPPGLLDDQRSLEAFRLRNLLVAPEQVEHETLLERVKKTAALFESAAFDGKWSDKTQQIWETIALIHEAVGVADLNLKDYEWLLSALSWQVAGMPSIGSLLASKLSFQAADHIERIAISFSKRDFVLLETITRRSIHFGRTFGSRAQRANNLGEALYAGMLISLGSFMNELARFVNYQTPELPDTIHMNAFLDLGKISGASRYYRIGRILFDAVKLFSSASSRFQIDQINTLTSRSRSRIHQYLRKYPELWPSQKDAISKGLLNPSKKHFVVSVPTSSGKTLCGELAIIQHLADNPENVCFYVVPTRALVAEKSRELEDKLSVFGYRVAGATSALQRDQDLEASMLQNAHVIVCTPEKLDLLIRHDDACLINASLFVIDETHLISDDDRGLGLEFVVIKILLLKPEARILLLSAMLPNSEQFGRWLSNDAVVSSLQWRPTRQRFGEIRFDNIIPRGSCQKIVTYDSTGKFDGIEIQLREYSRKPNSILEKVIWSVDVLKSRGPILVFCMSKARCEEVVDGIVKYLEAHGQKPTAQSEKVKQLRIKIRREIAKNFLLEKSLAYGIAYHHADLPPRIRVDLENLISANQVQVVVSTTTLAEGVNLPISTVIFEDWMTRGDPRIGQKPEPLNLSKFLNISGRAGRAGQENEGLILFLDPDHKPIDIGDREMSPREYFIRESYPSIESRFLDVITSYQLPKDEALDQAWNQGDKIWKPEIRRALRQFGSAVLHAMEVFQRGTEDITDRIIDHSLLAVQAPDQKETAKQWFGTWVRFYKRVELPKQELRPIAMQVGLPLRSVQGLYSRLISMDDVLDLYRIGKTNNLVLDDDQISSSTSAIALIQELDWEPEDAPHGKLLTAWINGEPITRLADLYTPHLIEKTRLIERTCNYVTQKLSNSGSWGMYAFSRVLALILDEDELSPITNRLPLMAYFGVNSVPSVVLSLIGVERIDALRLGTAFLQDGNPDFSIGAIKLWAKRLGIRQLEGIIRGQEGRDIDIETLKSLRVI